MKILTFIFSFSFALALSAQSYENKYFAVFLNVNDGQQYFTTSKIEPLYEIKDFVKASRKPEYVLRWSGVVGVENDKIVKISYDRDKLYNSEQDQKLLSSLARFIDHNRELFGEDIDLAVYSPSLFSKDPEISIKIHELKAEVSKFLEATKAKSDGNFYSPFSGQLLAKNMFLSMLATQLVNKLAELESSLVDIAKLTGANINLIVTFLEEMSLSLGYMEAEDVEKGLKDLSKLFSFDVEVEFHELGVVKQKPVIKETVDKPIEEKEIPKEVKEVVEVKEPEYIEPGDEIKQRIMDYYSNVIPGIKASLSSKNLKELANFCIVASIPNSERQSFSLNPKYLELLFGTPWNNWNDGVIYIASKYSDKRIMELFALRFLANAPSDVMYYEKPVDLVFTKLTLNTFLAKPGGSQVALLKHANDALSNKALNVEDQELVDLASTRLQKVSNASYVKQASRFISSNEYTLVPRNDNEAIDLMRGYTLIETNDVYKQLDAVLWKMAKYKGIYFGQEEAELWFNKGLYEYIDECSQLLDQKDPNKKELEFALIIIGALGIQASSTGNVLLTREGFDKIIKIQTHMEIGSKYCTKVFNNGIKKYRTRATYEFYSQLSRVYYGMIKY